MTDSRISVVVTTCGNTKLPHAAPAERFYCGAFVKSQRAAAGALCNRYLILSNKHGFMTPNHVVPGPYDSHWGYPDTMPDAQLRAQVQALHLPPAPIVVCLGAAEYARRTIRYFPNDAHVYWPAKHLPDIRMGYQWRLHNAIVQLGKLPGRCWQDCRLH